MKYRIIVGRKRSKPVRARDIIAEMERGTIPQQAHVMDEDDNRIGLRQFARAYREKTGVSVNTSVDAPLVDTPRPSAQSSHDFGRSQWNPGHPDPGEHLRQRYCPFCSEAIMPNAKKCKHCGEWLDPTVAPSRKRHKERKSKLACVLLAIFFTGLLGIHNFYVGRNMRGTFQLVLTIFGSVNPAFIVFVCVWLLIETIYIALLPSDEFQEKWVVA